MKKLGLLLLFAMIIATVSVAQDRGMGNFDPKEMAKRQTDDLTKLLTLNKDQQKKVLELNQKSAESMQKMRDEMMNGGGDREKMREQMTKSRDEQTKEMKKILTADQFTKYEKYLEERRSGRQGGPGGQR